MWLGVNEGNQKNFAQTNHSMFKTLGLFTIKFHINYIIFINLNFTQAEEKISDSIVKVESICREVKCC